MNELLRFLPLVIHTLKSHFLNTFSKALRTDGEIRRGPCTQGNNLAQAGPVITSDKNAVRIPGARTGRETNGVGEVAVSEFPFPHTYPEETERV